MQGVKRLWAKIKSKPKLSKYEKKIAKHLYNTNYIYLARYDDGTLVAYQDKPMKFKQNGLWITAKTPKKLNDFEKDFRLVKWENDEPTAIADLIEED